MVEMNIGSGWTHNKLPKAWNRKPDPLAGLSIPEVNIHYSLLQERLGKELKRFKKNTLLRKAQEESL
jgi:hypothetical protein